jgi:2-polyprenyl-3-methyl-5-hydroxy-6-metoxy-1,4-benzoquinol methylase
MAKVHYSRCPLCNSEQINPLLTVKDHSVSQESFVIWQCNQCTLRFTQDVPDEASIGSYYRSENYISHSNTSKGGVNRMYQKVRNYTLDTKANLIKSHTVDKGKILDLGAGTGAFLATMKNKGWDIRGIEPDEGAREVAKNTFHIELGETKELQELPKSGFDAITLWHVLEHVHQLHLYVEQLKSLLKPEGKLFIAVPNYTSVDHSIYKLYWAAYDVPRHLYHFTPKSIRILMKGHGLRVEQIKPMWFDSFYISLLSSRYKNGRESWIGAGLSGLRSNINALFNKERCSSLIYIIGKDQRAN